MHKRKRLSSAALVVKLRTVSHETTNSSLKQIPKTLKHVEFHEVY